MSAKRQRNGDEVVDVDEQESGDENDSGFLVGDLGLSSSSSEEDEDNALLTQTEGSMTAGAAGYHDSFLTTYHQGKPSKRLRMAILQSPDADSRQLPSAKDPLKVFSFAAGGEVRRLGVFQTRLLELHSLQTGPAENPGSWFVGESVCSTGPLAAATLLDPLFVLLPMLEATHKKEPAAFRLFDQVLSEHAAAVAAQFKLPDSSCEQRHDTKAWPQVFRSLAPSFEAECLPL